MRVGTLHVARFCGALIEAGVLIGVVIAPLYFNTLTYRTFEPDKAALLRSVVLVMVAAWIAKQLAARPSDSAFHLPSSILRPPPLFLSVFLLLAATLFSTATSILPRVSLWGSYDRGQGLYTFLAYLALFFLTFEMAHRPATRARILHAILLASVPVSVYAILQHYGLDILPWQTAGTATAARAISTLGNPIFLGAYLIMVIPVALGQLARSFEAWAAGESPRAGAAVVYGALLAVQAAALFFAQSRGPVIGLLGGLVFGALAWGARLRGQRALLAGAAVLALIVAIVGAAQLGGLGRLANLISPTARTAQQRILAWQGVVSLMRADTIRALIGYGPETLREALPPYLPEGLARLVPDQDFDRAHNLVLDTWTRTGLLGVVAWLALVAAVVYRGLHALAIVDGRRAWVFAASTAAGAGAGLAVPVVAGQWAWTGVATTVGLLGGMGVYLILRMVDDAVPLDRLPATRQWTLLALLTGIVAHVAETLVGIPTVATQVLFWVYVALIAAVASSERTPGPPAATGDGPVAAGVSVWGALTGVVLALLAFPLFAGVPAELVRGVLLWAALATTTLLFGTLFMGLTSPELRDAVAYRYLIIAASSALAFFGLRWVPLPPPDYTRSTVAVFLYVILTMTALGLILGSRDSGGGSPRRPGWPEMVLYGLLAILVLAAIWLTNVNPVRADVFYKEGLARSGAGEWEGAVAAYRRSLMLMPREDRYHSGLGAGYVQLAQRATEAAERSRWLQFAEASLLQAQRLDPFRADHLRNVGLLYRLWAGFSPPGERASRLRQALTYYERAARRNPIGVRIWREWGEVHAALGEWDAAAQRYEESLRLNDGFVETWLLLAEARLRQADYGGAFQAYVRALALDENRVLQSREAAVARSPDDPVAHQSLALVYAALGDSQAALAEAEVARSLMGQEGADWARFLGFLNTMIAEPEVNP